MCRGVPFNKLSYVFVIRDLKLWPYLMLMTLTCHGWRSGLLTGVPLTMWVEGAARARGKRANNINILAILLQGRLLCSYDKFSCIYTLPVSFIITSAIPVHIKCNSYHHRRLYVFTSFPLTPLGRRHNQISEYSIKSYKCMNIIIGTKGPNL